MNYIDILILLLIAWAAYRGFSRGFVVMIATFIALIVGIWGAIRFSGTVGNWLVDIMNISSPYITLISFTITFIVLVVAINIGAYLFSRFLDAIALGIFNRLFGSLFGILKMALLLSVLFLIINAFDSRNQFMPQEQVESSLLYRPVARLAPGIFPFLSFDSIAREIEQLILD